MTVLYYFLKEGHFMHYCIYLFTKNLPTDEEIEEIMAPYSEYAENESPHPDIQWDGYEIGGRYGGMLMLKADSQDNDKYRWYYYIDEPRAGRLFRHQPLENLLRMCRDFKSSREYGFYGFNHIEYTLFNYCGLRRGYLHVDGCKISDLYNLDEVSDCGCGFIDVPFNRQETRYTRSREEKPGYEDLLKEAFERNRDHYVTILDLHI